MRQFGVRLECCFVHPPGMNVEEPPVSHGTKQMKVQASLLFARRTRHIAQCLLNGALFSFPRMHRTSNSGVMNLRHQSASRVYQKDLGPDTATLAPSMTE